MTFPENLRYTKDHEWVRIEEDGTATVGITEYAQRELGDIVYVDIESEGTDVDQEGVFGTIEAVKTVSELYAPLSGSIVAINEALDGDPQLVNSDPYGEGWLARFEVKDMGEVDGLLTAEAYGEMVG